MEEKEKKKVYFTITIHALNESKYKFYALFLEISNLLVVCNSTLNCIMYVMLGKKFREQFVKAFCPKLYRKRIKNLNANFLNVQNNTRLNGEHSLI